LPFSKEQRDQIIDAIETRLDGPPECPLCGGTQWTFVGGGLAFIDLIDDAEQRYMGGPALPNVALICTDCGHTLFFNIYFLGLGHLVEDLDER